LNTALPIREFAYLDRGRLEDFLSPLVGGLPYEAKEGLGQEDARIDAEANLKVISLGRKGGQARLSWEELRRATPASLFDAFFRELDQRGAVRPLDTFSNDVWEQIRVGEFVDIPCNVEFSSMESLFDLVASIKDLLELLAPDQLEDPSSRQMVAYLDLINRSRDSYNVRLLPAGAPTNRHILVASLDKQHVRVNKSGLSGPYRVFGRAQQRLEKGTTFELFSFVPGFKLGREELRQLLAGFRHMPPQLGRPPQLEDLRVSHPAMVLTVVALYR